MAHAEAGKNRTIARGEMLKNVPEDLETLPADCARLIVVLAQCQNHPQLSANGQFDDDLCTAITQVNLDVLQDSKYGSFGNSLGTFRDAYQAWRREQAQQ